MFYIIRSIRLFEIKIWGLAMISSQKNSVHRQLGAQEGTPVDEQLQIERGKFATEEKMLLD